MISILPDTDDDIIIQVSDFGDLTGVIEVKPELPPGCRQGPVDVELAWRELQRSCRGG